MEDYGWKYYNHALIPTTPPNKMPNIDFIKDISNWKKISYGNKALLARWTTDWDCGEETNWWYIVKKAPYIIDELSKSNRKHIRQALKKCYVQKCKINENINELYNVYNLAFERYESADNKLNKDNFIKTLDKELDYWGAYDIETNKLIGWMSISKNIDYIEIISAKYIPQFLNFGISAALYDTILDFYLNKEKYLYCISGERSINHITNVQEYKIEHFKFEKAYCRVHIKYKKSIQFVIKIIYPFRKILLKFDSIKLMHQINSILNMEEIVRNNK